uniref:Uncharacterized protein n=1 Tax=Sphaerodactylus townsendi TaxID=933632 RepID=A0ACB8ETB8_9SAUR
MSTPGSSVTNRGRQVSNGAIDLSGPGSGRVEIDRGMRSRGTPCVSIEGYSDKQVPDTSVQRDRSRYLSAGKAAGDIALGPLKQIPMNLFIMYIWQAIPFPSSHHDGLHDGVEGPSKLSCPYR